MSAAGNPGNGRKVHEAMRLLYLTYQQSANLWRGDDGVQAVHAIALQLATRHEVMVFSPGSKGGPSEEAISGVRYLHTSPMDPETVRRLAREEDCDLVVDVLDTLEPPCGCLMNERPVVAWVQADPVLATWRHPRFHRLRQASLRHLLSGWYDQQELLSPSGLTDDLSRVPPPEHGRGLLSKLSVLDQDIAAIPYSALLREGDKQLRQLIVQRLRGYRAFVFGGPQLLTRLHHTMPAQRSAVCISNGADASLLAREPHEQGYFAMFMTGGVTRGGLEVALRAFERFSRRLRGITLVIADDGRGDAVRRGQADRIAALHPAVEPRQVASEEEMWELIQGALGVIVLSSIESCPVMAMAAAACGKAVIGNRTPVRNEAIVEGETGLLFDGMSEQELADAMERLATDQALRLTMGLRARERARELTWDVIARQHEQFYSEVIRHHTNA